MPTLDYRLVHATAGRLRLRVPRLRDPALEPTDLEAWLMAMPTVEAVRINRAAASLAVEHAADARAAVLARLGSFDPDALAPLGAPAALEDELAPVATALVGLALLPFMTPLAQRVTIFALTGRTLARGVDTLVNRGVKVEVLDALAVGLAAARGEVYTASLTGLLLALGEYLERRTARASDRLLRELLRPAPTLAWVERDGELVQVAGETVRAGEVVSVGPGETIPVDGRVVGGTALVNQAAVTGEDLPVRKEAPRRVVAGSTLVEGRLRIVATAVGAETTPARIARFIQASLDRDSATTRLADRLADQRVAITLATGAAVYAATRDLDRLQAVFLVDYACALKLGTPVAIKSGMVAAAHHGVLMKGATAIEALADADTLVFDKTGTLTHSELAVTDVVVFDPAACGEADLLALVASVEEHASHPVAAAVVEAARERDLEHISHGEVDYLVAHGLTATIGADGRCIRVGSRHFLEEHAGLDFAAHGVLIDALQDAGKTLLYVGDDAGPLGLIALRDTPRADVAETLKRLRGLGIRHLVMLTGDRRAKAQALAAELGIDEVHAELAPEAKAGIIEELRRCGHRVAFVGDGVNDGPALVTAGVGIAMPRGADLARATADIVLLEDRFGAVGDARALALHTMGRIRSNFRLAVGINSALLGGAVFGWLSPVMSALLHNGTTIGILLRALAPVRLDGDGPPG